VSEKVMSIWTDGSSHNNGEFQGIGGFGAVLIYSELPETKEELYGKYADDKFTLDIYGGADPTTNQQMELKSVSEAFKRIKNYNIPVHVFSDSAYMVNCFKDGWWHGWIQNGWKNSKKQPVANREEWEAIIEIMQNEFMDVTFHKVKGHSKIYYNERADRLADKGTQEMKALRLRTNT
jgi:ribonuclease HI